MRRFAIWIVLCTIVTSGYAQDVTEALLPKMEWGAGSILLNDGTELKGLVKYNDRTGLLSYENGNDSRSFTARHIVGFEFFDEGVQRQRFFLTLEYKDEDRDDKRPLLFEVLKEFKDFAVLSRYEDVEMKHKSTNTSYYYTNNLGGTSVTIQLTEKVYVLTNTGDIKPFLNLTYHYGSGMFASQRRTKSVTDKTVLKKYFPEPGYSRMQEYVKKEKLDMEDKEDYIKALTYYKETTE